MLPFRISSTRRIQLVPTFFTSYTASLQTFRKHALLVNDARQRENSQQEVRMSISKRLQEFLDTGGAAYEHHVHPDVFTAADTAESVHIPGSEMAKTVIVNADGLLRMAVIPANRMVDLRHLKFITRSENIHIASEREFRNAFPDCEVGAMPPFGSI